MPVVIESLGLANPARYATGAEVLAFFDAHFDLAPAERALYRKLLLDGPIRGRHIGVEIDAQAAELDADALNARFNAFGAAVGADACRAALAQAGLSPSAAGALAVCTCTGYLCPGLASYIAERLGASAETAPLELAGMGCGAAIPTLRAAAALAERDDRPVLAAAVEICSATMMLGPEPDLIVSNSIFGDVAAAMVLRRADAANGAWLARPGEYASLHWPQHREQLRYRMDGGRLRNTLSVRVPVVAARAVERLVERLLPARGLTRDDIDWWVVHPGGTAVLEQIGRRLGLPPAALAHSHEVFADCGNMSSPSVLFVLRRVLDDPRARPGDRVLMTAFGAGFTAHAALLELGPGAGASTCGDLRDPA